MKKTTLTIVMATLCLNFSLKAQSQIPQNKAIDVTTKGIQIGEKVPQTPVLSKYKGKLIILDFWATWCSPCVAMIPKMEKLQEQFKDQIQIIQITYQSDQEVRTFLNKLNKGKPSVLPQINGDKELHKLFPHIYLPHYIWIDPRGTIAAITGSEEINAANIRKLLSGGAAGFNLAQKVDKKLEYDPSRPLLIRGNGGTGDNLLYHSLMTTYTDGLGGGANFQKNEWVSRRKVTLKNMTIPWFFKIAYSAGTMKFHQEEQVRYELVDRTKTHSPYKDIPSMMQWNQHNTYCYELVVPPERQNELYVIMQEDLKRLFPQYEAEVIKQNEEEILVIRDKLKLTN